MHSIFTYVCFVFTCKLCWRTKGYPYPHRTLLFHPSYMFCSFPGTLFVTISLRLLTPHTLELEDKDDPFFS